MFLAAAKSGESVTRLLKVGFFPLASIDVD
jgi:hypothetical protein